jgi:hypothetical protein
MSNPSHEFEAMPAGADGGVRPMEKEGFRTAAALADRLRSEQPPPEPVEPEPDLEHMVELGPALQVEISGRNVTFLVPFLSTVFDPEWMRAYHDQVTRWPAQLAEPQFEEGRGVWLGPLPVSALEEHVNALKELVETSNRIYANEIVPELRRQQEEALRAELELEQLQAEVEARLRRLLG